MKFLHHYKSAKGFSVTELLVGIFILTFIGIAVATFQKDIFFLNRFLSGSLTAQDEARRALKTMTAEVRPLSPSSLGAYPIAEANSTSFIFYSNIDSDSLKERVRYFLDGAILKKGVIKPSGTPLTYDTADEIINEIVHDVSNNATPIFSYYDTNYNGITPPIEEPINIPSVRLVQITILINKNSSQQPGIITLTTQVSIRNLKDNL